MISFPTSIDEAKVGFDAAVSSTVAFDTPVPDALLLSGFLLALFAQRRASLRTFSRVQGLYADAYNSELLNANRKAYQARAELDRAKKEIESSRQKERRAKRDAHKQKADAKAVSTNIEQAPQPRVVSEQAQPAAAVMQSPHARPAPYARSSIQPKPAPITNSALQGKPPVDSKPAPQPHEISGTAKPATPDSHFEDSQHADAVIRLSENLQQLSLNQGDEK